MDAREQLRRYLEQRREAGEHELVLDSMAVDDVLRVLGAGTARAPERATDDRARPPGPERPVPARAEPSPSAMAGDWRAALRAAGAAPGATPARATAPDDAARTSPPPLPRRDRERAPAPSVPVAGDRGASMDGGNDATTGAPPGSATGPATRATSAAAAAGRAEAGHASDASRAGEASSGAGTSERVPPRVPASDGSPAAPSEVVPLEQLPVGLVVGSPAHELFGGESPWRTLDDIATAAGACQRCALYKTARQAVPGEGDPRAGFVCVGEAPGAQEDEQGRPFVGQAGQLLTKILAAIRFSREEVFICNVLKHRPPGNRNPTPDEVVACSPFLVRQLELLRPRVILALGTFAAQTLLQTREPIGKLRGRIHRYHGVPLIVTYHPAALLRNPSWKRPTWEDVQLARRLYDRARDA